MKLSRRRALGVLGGAGLAGAGYVGSRRFQTPRGSALLSFEDDVPAAVRERVRRATDRLSDIVGTSITEPVSVKLHEFSGAAATGFDPDSRFESVRAHALHLIGESDPMGSVRPAGIFDGDGRVLSLVDPETIPVSRYRSVGSDTSREQLLDEPLVAHELTHAVQDERFDSREAADWTRDAKRAKKSVIEGTADYVAGRYWHRCNSGGYDPCVYGPRIDPETASSLGPTLLEHLPYVNGRVFVSALHAAGGWDRVWDAHRTPPATTAAITFPRRYLDAPAEPDPPTPSDPSGAEWTALGHDRLGVFDLYAKLFALDVVSPADADARLRPRITTETSYEWTYRTDVLRGYRSDRFTACVHLDDFDRFAYRWETEWRRPGAAEAFRTAVARGYERRGRGTERGWNVGGNFHALSRTGTTVTLFVAPTAAEASRAVGF